MVALVAPKQKVSFKSTCRHCSKLRVEYSRGLCKPCYKTPGLKDQYPRRSRVKCIQPCAHCGTTEYGYRRLRGLCDHCYYKKPGVRELYAAVATTKPCVEEYAPPPNKVKDDAPFRCFWCSKWRCLVIFAICAECQADYESRSLGMPTG